MIRGFTLIEILVVLTVLTLTGGLLLAILTQFLSVSNKSQIVLVIKQNAQQVLNTLDKNIRNADNIVCVSTTPANTLVIFKDGIYTRYRLILQTTAVNGFVAFDKPTPTAAETPTSFINRICNPTDPLSSPTVLTDQNILSGVSLTSGQFIRDKLAGFRDKITIEFILDQGVAVKGSLATRVDPVTFKTTVELR